MTRDGIQAQLLDRFQRDFPVVPRPFDVLAERLGISGDEVIRQLAELQQRGLIARVGGCIRPNTIGASTLVAMSVPEDRLDNVASHLSGLAAVNHSYLREDDWNLWFVVTTPDETSLLETLAGIERQCHLPVLDLRLVRPFHIDLGFHLGTGGAKRVSPNSAELAELRESDRPLLQALSDGLPLTPQPFAALACFLQTNEAQVMSRIAALCRAGIVTRLGVIVRHRDLGWASNAMVVWDMPPERIPVAGEKLAALAGISLCYQRRNYPGVWPYGLYTMVHARSRPEALGVIAQASSLPEMAGVRHKVLFSTHCYKQNGAWVHRKEAA